MKALLIGSSFSAAPIFEAMRALGAQITVIGRDPDDPCHIYADESIYEDYSNSEALLAACQASDFDCIVPSCNDYAYMAATFVADKLGYPGFDTLDVAHILHTKDAYREKLKELSIPSPIKFGEFTPDNRVDVSQIAMPAIVKPVDSFSGRGVSVVHKKTDLEPAIQDAFGSSRQKRVLIEQFVEGTLHSHTAFVSNGEIFWHEFADEYCEVYPYAVDRSIFPSALPEKIKKQVHGSICRLVSDLKPNDGLMHTQFISSGEEYWVIECMRRCPGDLYGHKIELSCGIDYAKYYAMPFLGLPYDTLEVMPEAIGRVERRILTVPKKQPLFSVAFKNAGDNLEYIPLKTSGEELEKAPYDKAGILFSVSNGEDTSELLTEVDSLGYGFSRTQNLV